MERETPPVTRDFTVGICASDSADSLPSLVSFLLSEEYGDFDLDKIVIVASACPESTLTPVRRMSEDKQNITLMTEPKRNGKAEAIDRILESSKSEYMVMLNSDAFPEQGSIARLLETAATSHAGVVSAMPVPESGDGLLQRSLSLMWLAHSLFSLRLNHAGISNHACDELIVFRRSLVPRFPRNMINDGAYIGGMVRARGYGVNFSTSARVKIAVPNRLVDLIRQRRRIIFGHFQVWRKLGRAPRTMESMLLVDPMVSLRTLVQAASRRPSSVAALPVLLVGESISMLLSAIDIVRRTDRHLVWKRNA